LADLTKAEIAGDDPSAEIERAFERFRRSRAMRGALVLGASCRPSAALADSIVQAIEACPELRELVLVHPSSSVGFIASTLQLRLRNVSVSACRDLSELSPDSGSPLRRTGERLRLPVQTLPAGAGAAEVEAALEKVRAPRCAIAFDPSERPRREALDALATALGGRRDLEEVVLIHPSPSMGFLTSSLGLRAPHVTIRAVRAVEELVG